MLTTSCIQYFYLSFLTMPPPYQEWRTIYNLSLPQQYHSSQYNNSPILFSSDSQQKPVENESDTVSDVSLNVFEPCSSKVRKEQWSNEQSAALVQGWKGHFNRPPTLNMLNLFRTLGHFSLGVNSPKLPGTSLAQY